MVTITSFSVIFDTGATYSRYFIKGDSVDLWNMTLPRNLKCIAKGLDIYGYVIVDYSLRIESEYKIELWY